MGPHPGLALLHLLSAHTSCGLLGLGSGIGPQDAAWISHLSCCGWAVRLPSPLVDEQAGLGTVKLDTDPMPTCLQDPEHCYLPGHLPQVQTWRAAWRQKQPSWSWWPALSLLGLLLLLWACSGLVPFWGRSSYWGGQWAARDPHLSPLPGRVPGTPGMAGWRGLPGVLAAGLLCILAG